MKEDLEERLIVPVSKSASLSQREPLSSRDLSARSLYSEEKMGAGKMCIDHESLEKYVEFLIWYSVRFKKRVHFHPNIQKPVQAHILFINNVIWARFGWQRVLAVELEATVGLVNR